MKSMLSAVMMAILLFGCGGKGGEETSPHRLPVTGVETARVEARDVPVYYEISGTVKAETVSVVSAKVMGAVTSILVKNGDRVRKGQLLITIDDTDIKEKVKAAEAAYQAALNGKDMAGANLKLAENTYRRFRKLYEENALTRQEMEEVETKRSVALSAFRQAEAMLRQSEAALKEARAFLSYTRIKAPVDGIVSEKKIDVGTMASPGMPLIVIEDPSLYSVRVNVDESLFRSVKKGMEVDVKVDALDLDAKGTVAEISQSVDPLSRTFLVKVAVRGEGLRSGFYAKVRFPSGTRRTVIVPAGAIVKKGQLTGVYTVEKDGVVRFRLVRTGRKTGNGVEVLSGLAGGERIITSNLHRAVDGGVLADGKGQEEGR